MPATELVARFMGDNNIIHGKVTERNGNRLVIEDAWHVRASVTVEEGAGPTVGDDVFVSVRAASVELAESAAGERTVNSADCEIVFVEFLGDLVKLHLTAGGERMLAKVPGDRYPALRGREGETIRIAWKEEDVQLLAP
jgi:ABC-type Fe3+/spermidine/putrescine transport system ATPase subunit